MGYRRWDDDYWDGEVRETFAKDYLSCDVWHWLVTSVHASTIGVYRVPFRALAAACFLDSIDEAKEAVARVHDALGPLGKMKYDAATGWVWIVNAAKKQHDPINKPDDKRRRGKFLSEELDQAASSPFWPEFYTVHSKHLCILEGEYAPKQGPSKDLPRTFQGPPKVVRDTSEGDPVPYPPCPTLPALPNPLVHAREDARDPAPPKVNASRAQPEHRWSATVAEDAIRRYCEIVEKSGRYPVGDPDQAFERAALYLRDTMNWPEDDIGPVLLRIVELAAKDQEFRKHPKHGDLFLKVEFLVGSKVGRTAFGADVKLPEWINKLAADKPKLAAPRPPPQQEPTPEETEATMTAAQLRKRADDAVTSSLRLPKGDKFETMLLARAERCRKRADELDAAGAINATTAN